MKSYFISKNPVLISTIRNTNTKTMLYSEVGVIVMPFNVRYNAPWFAKQMDIICETCILFLSLGAAHYKTVDTRWITTKVIMKMFLVEVEMTRRAVMWQPPCRGNTDVGMRGVSLLPSRPVVQVMGQDPAANRLLIHVSQPTPRFV